MSIENNIVKADKIVKKVGAEKMIEYQGEFSDTKLNEMVQSMKS